MFKFILFLLCFMKFKASIFLIGDINEFFLFFSEIIPLILIIVLFVLEIIVRVVQIPSWVMTVVWRIRHRTWWIVVTWWWTRSSSWRSSPVLRAYRSHYVRTSHLRTHVPSIIRTHWALHTSCTTHNIQGCWTNIKRGIMNPYIKRSRHRRSHANIFHLMHGGKHSLRISAGSHEARRAVPLSVWSRSHQIISVSSRTKEVGSRRRIKGTTFLRVDNWRRN